MQFTEKIKKQLDNIRQFKLQEDRAILLSCIGIALVFWILVKLSQEYTSQKQVSFTYLAPEDLALTNIPPDDVYATLKGTGWNLMFEYLANSTIPVHFNIGEVGEFNLNRAQLRAELLAALASKELDITEINYDEINLRAEEKSTKRVPLRFRLRLEFAPEHHLSAPLRIDPDSVTLTGAYSVLNNFTSWPTDTLEFLDLTNTVTLAIPVQKPPPEIQLSARETELTIPVESYTEKSFFVPVTLKNPPSDSLKVFPDKIKVSFAVGLSQYDSVHYTDFQLMADLKATSLEKGKNTVPVEITAQPKAVKNVVLSRKSVEFFILKPEENKTDKPQ
ncbi:YbbR-like domain-containing protein [Flavilitoribacter nigricans]|uniref:YbbR-like domain-containing protein n=1 Tax=Flavilitoribacter nigricans (strain ATCC 23147 / DSM 23189 / NBRC 102662 / NCIMB 1420 / SS-2) TaxID=1122177 RepID=A0A2D0NIY0_FLAN2|nr:hypothetical protein [Flavilitoribacter nigricans]PHN08350.1 hypothetical protein CRP01_00095 [Flavilitoribacter nigricans DSM 23189 = NBRC 102662]